MPPLQEVPKVKKRPCCIATGVDGNVKGSEPGEGIAVLIFVIFVFVFAAFLVVVNSARSARCYLYWKCLGEIVLLLMDALLVEKMGG